VPFDLDPSGRVNENQLSAIDSWASKGDDLTLENVLGHRRLGGRRYASRYKSASPLGVSSGGDSGEKIWTSISGSPSWPSKTVKRHDDPIEEPLPAHPSLESDAFTGSPSESSDVA
jgi:hypothetical protein